MNKRTSFTLSTITLLLLFSFQISLSMGSAQEVPPVDYTQIEHPHMGELSDAVYWGNVERVSQLLDSGVPANGIHPSGIHPLLRASTAARPEIIHLLITHGADANKKYDYKVPYTEKETLTPLQALTRHSLMGTTLERLADAAKTLIAFGADPNQADDSGNTPLHIIACYYPFKKQMIETLLDGGAYPFQQNNEGQTPREAIAKAFLSPMFEYPFKRGEEKWRERIRMQLHGTPHPVRRRVKKKKQESSTSSTNLLNNLPTWKKDNPKSLS